jgi:hypothetical protein
MDVNLKMSSFAHRPLTGPEKKYGRNEWETLELCPRCACANPVKVVQVGDHWELHCRKCIYYGHVEGSLIRTVKTPHAWAEKKLDLKDIDWSKVPVKRIMDG